MPRDNRTTELPHFGKSSEAKLPALLVGTDESSLRHFLFPIITFIEVVAETHCIDYVLAAPSDTRSIASLI